MMPESLSVRVLLELCVSDDADVRADVTARLEALDAIWSAPDVPSALRKLAAALTSRNEEVARNASRWLIRSGALGVPVLQEALHQEGDDRHRQRALFALSRIGAPAAAALDDIRACLGDPADYVRAAAASALAEIGPAAGTATPELVAALHGRSWDLQQAAARALSRIGPQAARLQPSVIGDLIELFASESDDVRSTAAEAVAAMDELARPWLCRIIEDKDRQRAEETGAKEAITEIEATRADPTAVGPDEIRNWSWRVWQRLESRTDRVVDGAVGALGRMTTCDDDSLRALASAARDRNPAIRLKAVRAFGRYGAEARPAIPVLVGLLAEMEPAEREEIVHALDRIGKDWPSVPECEGVAAALLPGLKSAATRDSTLATMTRLGAVAVPALVTALRTGDRVVRESAARTLQKIGPAARDAAPALEALAANEEENQFVRTAAAEALGAIGGVRES